VCQRVDEGVHEGWVGSRLREDGFLSSSTLVAWMMDHQSD